MRFQFNLLVGDSLRANNWPVLEVRYCHIKDKEIIFSFC